VGYLSDVTTSGSTQVNHRKGGLSIQCSTRILGGTRFFRGQKSQEFQTAGAGPRDLFCAHRRWLRPGHNETETSALNEQNHKPAGKSKIFLKLNPPSFPERPDPQGKWRLWITVNNSFNCLAKQSTAPRRDGLLQALGSEPTRTGVDVDP